MTTALKAKPGRKNRLKTEEVIPCKRVSRFQLPSKDDLILRLRRIRQKNTLVDVACNSRVSGYCVQSPIQYCAEPPPHRAAEIDFFVKGGVLMRVSVVTSTICLAIAGVCAGQNAPLAQETSGKTASDELPEIIVTAEKRSQNLQDVPASVSALSGETLQA